MHKILFTNIFVLLFLFPTATSAQFGFQIGADGTTIFNPNPNTLVFPFTPIINYEMAMVNKTSVNEKLAYKIEIGYANKGALQSGGATTKSFVKNSLGYLYGLFGFGYEFAEDWQVQLAVAPSYLVLYKKYDKGSVQNYIGIIDNRYKIDVPLAISISRIVGKLNEFTIRYSHSTAPFAVQRNVFPTPSVDRFYNLQLGIIYTFYFPTTKTNT